ncbi:MAG: COG3014 family protein, partial [Owenweeksia sp.]
NEKAAKGRNRLLYFMQKGVVLQMQGKFAESNTYLEQAYTFIDDYKKNMGSEALSLLTNPMMKPYTGEDHEKVLIHYYKALNYLQLQQPQSALVEARRLNNKLNELNDKYSDKKNRYKDDAFAHTLMGIAYEMDHDVNNAFIAYRNAYNTYKDNYAVEFGVNAPEQLKLDLLRTAYLNGFRTELDFYEREFNMKYRPHDKPAGELVFFWHNGLGPVKDEWSINFTVIKGSGGMATFVNDDMGLNFAFPVSENSDGKGDLGDLKLVRMAFPKYLQRSPFYYEATLQVNGNTYAVEPAENINAIALSVLEDRMLREMGTSLLRLALKQATEYVMREENENMGTVVGLVNALTEKADTRNWQTLPHSISYARVPLKEGSNSVKLKTKGPNGALEESTFTFDVQRKDQTLFHVYSTLDSSAPHN